MERDTVADRQVAEAATQGNWITDGTKSLGAYGVWTDYATHPGHDGEGYGSQICCVYPNNTSHFSREQRDANAAFIATFCPATVLAYIAEVEQLRQENGNLKDKIDAYFADGLKRNRNMLDLIEEKRNLTAKLAYAAQMNQEILKTYLCGLKPCDHCGKPPYQVTTQEELEKFLKQHLTQ